MLIKKGLSSLKIFQKCARYCSTQVNQNENYTHFGFQNVTEEEKAKKVHEVFENVAQKYDIMNDVMSLGIQRLWKDIFIDRLVPTKDTKLLDCAGGTGDIAFRFLEYVKNGKCDENCHVVLCDINKNMLDVGLERSKKLGYDPKLLSFQEANAENLPFEDNSFDAYTIAFGLRNVTHQDLALKEAFRVLKPGGRFLCLEFSHLIHPTAQWMYDEYSFQVIPVMGHIIAGQWEAYQYLVESIRKFPNQESLKGMIENVGFQHVSYENLSFGIVAIHSGFKL